MTSTHNLLGDPTPVLLPEDPASPGLASANNGTSSLEDIAARYPTSSAAWAFLAEQALADGKAITAYAYARTGYHRGLDALRRNGWKGSGPVPWSHEPNQGFLRAVNALARAAGEIGESDEAARCAQLLRDCDPAAADELS